MSCPHRWNRNRICICTTILITACTQSQLPPDPAPGGLSPSSAAEELPQVAESESSSSTDADIEIPTQILYRQSICNGEVPETWHVRSPEDQEAWNDQCFIQEMTAEEFFRWFPDPPLPCPAIFSMADANTTLLGSSDDPGAEDRNRNELDLLPIDAMEFQKIIDQIEKNDFDQSIQKSTIEIDGERFVMIRFSEIDNPKYGGMELYFISPEQLQNENGLILYNRSPSWSENSAFREGMTHFLSTIELSSCAETLGLE